ncbi:MAG: hypothetical protein H7288_10440 [Kineosporiaceae bacterium]|nr:hypothetical protein [Aeromicrobium sp.]
MVIKKALASLALLGAAATLLAGCSTPSTSNAPAGSLRDSATPTPTPKAAAMQPFNGGGYLGGNAKPMLPGGDSGKVSVVSQGPLLPNGTGSVSGTLLLAFRNNTSKAVSHVDFTGTATANGKLVASGQSQGTIPAQVQPGEPGFAYIYFEDSSSIPAAGVTYDFKVTTAAADTSSYNTAPLTVGQASNNGTSIIGSAVNKTGKPLTGPYSVSIYCLNGNAPTDQITDYTSENGDITAGASVSFSTNLYGTSCDTYAVGVSGFFQ